MENFSYPIKLEPLSRPANPARKRTKNKRRVAPAQPPAARKAEPLASTSAPAPATVGTTGLAAGTAAPAFVLPEVITPERVAEPQPAPPMPASEKAAARRAERTRQHLELKAERERNGVSLKAIADNTRIPLRHLEELERGDIDNWPAGVYAKSWARDYAKEAGIAPDRVMAMVAPVAEVEPTIEEIREVRDEVERKRVDESPLAALVELARKFAAVIVVFVLLVLAALFFWNSDSRAANQADPTPVGTAGVAPAPPR